ncbi:MAG: SDR family oxidoreductase [Myxococcales bacterium]|nr:SDR family oxidoreductase [Myxococcales bacterium]
MGAERYFKGKRAVITGGSSGIGLALAKRLVRLGSAVVLVARRKDVLDAARAELLRDAPGASVEVVALDVARADDVTRAMAEVVAKGPVDVLVNNAGVVMPGRFLELPLEEFRTMMDVNFFGTVHLCKALLPHMVERKSGHVLNVSSLAGVIGIYGYTPYAASKFALCGFSQALRAEMWPHGVRVSLCLPPDTDTPQLAFESQHKPEETKAIAGTVKTLSADQVAKRMVDGMARGAFEIYPDMGSRMTAFAHGAVPSVVRWFCDSAQKKVSGKATGA